MTLNDKSLKELRELINEKTQYRTGPDLVKLFSNYGFNDVYGQGFPSRWSYTDEKLEKLNGTSTIDQIIMDIFNPINYIGREEELNVFIEEFNKYLAFDDYKLLRKGKDVIIEKANFEDTVDDNVTDFLNQNIEVLNIEQLPIDEDMYPIIQQRIQEIDLCIKNEIPLSAIFLSGSVLEGILSEIANRNPSKFNQAKTTPKDENGKPKILCSWSLNDFINVAAELEYVNADVKKFSHVLRGFRNYIHPRQQLREKFNPNIDTAKICVQVLRVAINQIIEKTNEQNKQYGEKENEHNNQNDLQNKFFLFEKRNEIYHCFIKYWNIANVFFVGDDYKIFDNQLYFDNCFFHGINNSSLETLYEQCIELRKEDVNERSEKTRNAKEKLNIETNRMKDKDISVISQIRYCYEKIPNVDKVEKFVEIISKTALSVFNRDVNNWDSNFSQLKILWEDINIDKLKENLEKQLDLS